MSEQQDMLVGSPWIMLAVRPHGKRVVIVGSGAVARRRAEQFISRGATVVIIDPNVDEERADLPAGVLIEKRDVQKRDVRHAWLVVVATSNPAVNQKVGAWAEELNVNCNRTDDAESGTVAVPAMMEDDLGWKVAVLGGDAGPLFSAWVKGLVGHLVASERIGQVYTAMATARVVAESLPLEQKDRAFLLRKVMARILESNEEIDAAALVRTLYAERTQSA